MANFQTSPGYQLSLDQGLRAVDAGRGGEGFAALRRDAQGGADVRHRAGGQEFRNYYNRLFDLSKLGENAAGGTAQASTQRGRTGMAQTDLSLGSAQTSIYGNAAQGIGNAVQNYAEQPALRSAARHDLRRWRQCRYNFHVLVPG